MSNLKERMKWWIDGYEVGHNKGFREGILCTLSIGLIIILTVVLFN